MCKVSIIILYSSILFNVLMLMKGIRYWTIDLSWTIAKNPITLWCWLCWPWLISMNNSGNIVKPLPWVCLSLCVHFPKVQIMHKVKNAELKHESGHHRPCSDSNKPLELNVEALSMPSSSSKTVLIVSQWNFLRVMYWTLSLDSKDTWHKGKWARGNRRTEPI